jgi:hypothetical protein
MMQDVFGDPLYESDTLIFYTSNVTLNHNLHKGRCLLIEFEEFSLIELRKNPFIKIQEYRKRITSIRKYLNPFVHEFQAWEELNVVIGTEKDNFTQVFLNILYEREKLRKQLFAVEEGLGYYIREGWSDHLKSLAYRLFTPIIFGERLNYHKQLGTDSRIDFRYVRLPELVPKYRGRKLPNLRAVDIPRNTFHKQPLSGKVLVFSFVNGDFGIDDEKKYKVFESLIGRLEGKQVFIKPHPRESVDVFDRFQGIKVFAKGKPGESFDYFQYEQIVNFTSSVIIDILARGYPPKNIVTVEMRKTGLPFFEETQILKLRELIH